MRKINILFFILLPSLLCAQTSMNMNRGTFNVVSSEEEENSQKRTANTVDGLGRRAPQRYVPVVVDGKKMFYDQSTGYLIDAAYGPGGVAPYQSSAPTKTTIEPGGKRPNRYADTPDPKILAWPRTALNLDASGLDGSGVLAAVFDSGTNQHEQFASGSVDLIDITGARDPNREEMALGTDDYGHGTTIVGIIAGDGAQGASFKGVAPGAKVKSYRVTNHKGETDSEYLIKALNSVAEYNKMRPANRITVINISYGLTQNNDLLKDALKRAYDSGITIVAATGNDGINGVMYPAAYDFVIGVGGITPRKKEFSLSNYGAGLDFVAPSAGLFVPEYNGGYDWVRGTSFSSAYITGVAVLITQAFKAKHGRTPSPKEVYDILKKISVKLPEVAPEKQGNGLPDAAKITAAI